jgi:tRNA(Ile)-lysidine synthetase-like protein
MISSSGAISPFAPLGRNAFLHSPTTVERRRTSSAALMLVLGLIMARWKQPVLRKMWKQVLRPMLQRMFQSAQKTLEENTKRQESNANERDAISNSNRTTIHSSLKELQQIDNVLNYWFGQYPPQQAQKKLWMITDEAWRNKIDEQIAQQFTASIQSMWNEYETNAALPWCADQYGYRGKMAAIILLDQMARHMQRYYASSSPLPPQSQLDQLAFRIAERLQKEHASEWQASMIPIPMMVFALMPYRHQSSRETVQYVQERIAHSAVLWEQCHELLRRFRTATNRRMAMLYDEERRHGDNPNGDEGFTDDDILECAAFPADLTLAPRHVVTRTLQDFVQTHVQSKETKTWIVSLSGGVDSMVIAFVLNQLRAQFQLPPLVAVHIDYANRPESSAEAQYVQRYCAQLGIVFRCRRIDEVTRGITARDEYERIAREIRYQAYRDAIDEFDGIGILLGHHKGDLRENVLSNAHKGCGPLDLSGMTAVSQNDGVTLLRPLLPLEKSAIFDYAHQFGVPYFKDTTPHWSTRGKLRNRLVPLLEEVYGEGSMNNLSSLAVDSDECRALFHQVALQPFLDQTTYKKMGLQFATAPWKEQGLFFWKFVLREVLHSAGLGMFSDKSVVSFLERVQAKTLKEGWLQCRKDYGVHLQKDGTVSVFYPRCFPFREADRFAVGEQLEYGKAKAVGPWSITAQVLPQELEPDESGTLVEMKAYRSFAELMNGTIDYYLPAPFIDGQVHPLLFTHFTRRTRPTAWKNLDLKLQEMLPLVGNDDIALGELSDLENPRAIVRVTLSLSERCSRREDGSDHS